MGRAKLNLKPIQDARVKSTTYKKRAASLLKKAEELAVLCGVQICVIIVGPPLFGQPREVVTFPENNPVAIKSLIDKYTSLPQTSKTHQKRLMKLSDILNVRKQKAEILLTKMRKGNKDSKYPLWDKRFNRVPEERLLEFARYLEFKLRGIKMLKSEKRKQTSLANQNLGVKNENTNNFGAQKKLIEFLPPQFPPGLNLNDSFARFDQGHRIDQNQAMMRFMNDNSSASCSNVTYAPQQHLIYYDPILIPPSPFSYYAPAPHHIGHLLQLQMNSGASSRFHGFQMIGYAQGCEKSKLRE